MTDTLDAIRARDAADITITLDWTGADWRRALWQVAADRRTLLAEVDRLTLLGMSEADYLNGWRDGQAAERARIAALVRGLHRLNKDTRAFGVDIFDGEWVDRAAVLRVIEGGER